MILGREAFIDRISHAINGQGQSMELLWFCITESDDSKLRLDGSRTDIGTLLWARFTGAHWFPETWLIRMSWLEFWAVDIEGSIQPAAVNGAFHALHTSHPDRLSWYCVKSVFSQPFEFQNVRFVEGYSHNTGLSAAHGDVYDFTRAELFHDFIH